MIERLLTYGIGVAISPISITVVVLFLSGSNGRRKGALYAIGVVGGLAVVVAIADLVVAGRTGSPTGKLSTSGSLSGGFNIFLGCLLLVLAWRRFSAPSGPKRQPPLMRGVANAGSYRILALGALIGAVNPKELGIAINVGAEISGVDGTVGHQVGLAAAFLVIATITITAPVVLAYVAPRRSATVLERLHGFLTLHGASVGITMLAVYGTIFVGKGIDALS